MNSRQRVLTTLAHREPDRVPTSFSGIFDAPPYGYRALCAHLGITDYPEPVNLHDVSGLVSNPDERLLARLYNDLRSVSGGSSYVPVELPDGSIVDEWGLVYHEASGYWDILESEAPLRDARNMDDVRRYGHFPSRTDPAISAGIREQALAFRDAGYPVFAVPSWAEDIFWNYAATRGFSQWLMDIYEDPYFYHAYSEFLLEMAVEYLETFLPTIADAIDVVILGEDLGSQLSPFMSPALYGQFCKPYHVRWCEEVRRLAPGKAIGLHTCGNVYPLIPDFIEMGVSILNPVQPLARMMEPWRLKQEFGRDLTFYGGFDIQELLPHGSVQQIRDGAKALIDTYGPGGGFIFCPSHSIQGDVPPENVVAMYDAAIEFGLY